MSELLISANNRSVLLFIVELEFIAEFSKSGGVIIVWTFELETEESLFLTAKNIDVEFIDPGELSLLGFDFVNKLEACFKFKRTETLGQLFAV